MNYRMDFVLLNKFSKWVFFYDELKFEMFPEYKLVFQRLVVLNIILIIIIFS